MLPSSRSFTSMLVAFFLFLSTTTAEVVGNQTMGDGPLFDTYQFLSPGIMMGFLVVFLLAMILYVGVSALASLEVTYAAFEKESGPGSKKQQ